MKTPSVYTTMLAVCLLAACSSNDDGDQAAANYSRVDCMELSGQEVFAAGLLGDDTVECGLVTVPADWSVENGDTIKLAIYRIFATSANPAPDPLVYLEGGPGGSGAPIISEFVSGSAAYLRERSDVIVIDQRGTGYSRPALFCPEVFRADAEDGDVVAAYQACHDRLVGEGVRFADYNSAYNAQDVNAVRQALGFAEWNLYGLSYGTRLALTVMRDVPEGVRSVVLDSVFPPEINGLSETPYVSYWTIEQIASNCAADADCSANIGDIKALIEDGIARLDAAPVGDISASFYVQALAELMTDSRLVTIVSTVASGTDTEILTLAQEVEASLDDDDAPSPNEVPAALYPFVAESDGMGYAVICGEEVPYLEYTAGPEIAANFRESTQRVIDAMDHPFDGSLCDIYTVPARGEIETQPVMSRIPTLVLAGTADVATPPAWSMLTDDALANSQYAEFDGLAHGLLGNNECLNQITLAFLNDPGSTADQACIVDLPRVDYVTE
ncbi:MAG: alpha/beta hydrolase [Granulosicoccus sp.]